jgi:DNA-binding beta-propeller fold protein YncE
VRKSHILLIAGILLGLNACSLTPDIRPIKPPVYPPQPEQPRYVFEGTLRSSNNITEPTFGDKLQEIATGIRVDPLGLAKPYGVAVKDKKVYVSDTQQRAVIVFDLENRQVKSFGTEGPGRLLKPLGMDISNDNELYVVDISAKRIAVYDLNGTFLRAIGGEHLFLRPVGVAAHPTKPWVYVVDTGGLDTDKHHIFQFDRKTGQLLKTIGTRGQGDGEFNLPLQASMTHDGKLYVVDSANFRIQALDEDGKFLDKFGQIGRRSGQFSRPKGIATDNNGKIYVSDTAFGNFQIFTPKGELLLFIGTRATSGGPGLYSLPAGIDVDKQGRVFVVDQFFRKVDIFRPVDLAPLPVFKTQVQQ